MGPGCGQASELWRRCLPQSRHPPPASVPPRWSAFDLSPSARYPDRADTLRLDSTFKYLSTMNWDLCIYPSQGEEWGHSPGLPLAGISPQYRNRCTPRNRT